VDADTKVILKMTTKKWVGISKFRCSEQLLMI